jgi:hypothetical protein
LARHEAAIHEPGTLAIVDEIHPASVPVEPDRAQA